MPPRQQPNPKFELEHYKAEIHTMLLAKGCEDGTAIQLISDNDKIIRGWIDPKGKGPIITAAIAARILLGNEGVRTHEN